MTSKIINSKRYDTDKATCIGSYANSHNTRDFHQYSEALYVTSNGNFFLVGEGGPMSKYSRSTGQNEWSGSSDNVTPLTRADALKWCEEHDINAATIDKYFTDLLKDA